MFNLKYMLYKKYVVLLAILAVLYHRYLSDLYIAYGEIMELKN